MSPGPRGRRHRRAHRRDASAPGGGAPTDDLDRRLLHAFHRLWQRCQRDPREAARRHARTAGYILRSVPRAWCLSLRAGDTRLTRHHGVTLDEHAVRERRPLLLAPDPASPPRPPRRPRPHFNLTPTPQPETSNQQPETLLWHPAHDPLAGHRTFACAHCWNIQHFSLTDYKGWNELITHLTTGLLHGHEVQRPEWVQYERKQHRRKPRQSYA